MIAKYYELLKECPLFSHIQREKLPHLMDCVDAREKKYKSEEYLWFSGDTINSLGIVLSGSLELIKENAAGQKLILDFVAPTHIFGEGIICTKDRISPVSVAAREDSVVLLLPFDKVIRPCSHSCVFHHQLIQNIVTILGEKNRLLNRKIELLAMKGMREKLATYLLYEEARLRHLPPASQSAPSLRKQNPSFTITANRSELAEYLNVSRSSMCRELGRMKELGMIDYYQNTFRILNRDALKKCLMQT